MIAASSVFLPRPWTIRMIANHDYHRALYGDWIFILDFGYAGIVESFQFWSINAALTYASWRQQDAHEH